MKIIAKGILQIVEILDHQTAERSSKQPSVLHYILTVYDFEIKNLG